jgi:3-hydroxybutyrate dehydrogenase
METEMKLEQNVAVVTGAGSGIGREIALAFVREGARVAICDIDMNGARETEGLAKELGSGETLIVEMDVTNEAALSAGVEKIAAKWGRVDTLVSNAGIQIVHPIEEFPLADYKRLLAIHLEGAFLTTKACVNHMYRQKRGALIYMGSVHSHEASALKSAYVAAKHGVLGLARVMAKEGAEHGVRSNVICPGFVRTPLVEKQIPEQAKSLGISEKKVVDNVMLGGTVDKQFTSMTDVAAVATFLAAFPTNALTGQSILVSHGWFMN